MQNACSISDIVMEKLHCTICSGFLSCSPVRVLPDGTFICGQCSPSSSSDLPIYRTQALESLLEKVSFQCRFAQRGCKERVKFGQTVEHELKCEYRSFACPLQHSTCSWEGSTSEILDHFTKAHPKQIWENANLKLQVNQNTEGVSVVSKENITFVVKYQYDAKNNHFTYDIRFCKSNSVQSISYKLQLINNSDPDYTFSLKTVCCSIYDDSFNSGHRALKLDLNKFFQCLDNPDSILISLNFTIHFDDNTSKDKTVVKLNYEVLDSLRCNNCQNCLVPPLFYLDGNVICCDCTKADKNYAPLHDTKLLQLLNKKRFSCRWRHCQVVAKNTVMKKHEIECKFRKYVCIFKCGHGDTLTLSSAINHYKTKHSCQFKYDYDQYKYEPLTFKISLVPSDTKDCVIIRKYTIVISKCSVHDCDSGITIFMLLIPSDTEIKDGSINFGHQHCKIKSKRFVITVGETLQITLNQLPSCFQKKDQLIGYLSVI